MLYKTDPIQLKKETWNEVIELYTDIRKMQIREEEEKAKNKWKEDLEKQGIKVKRATDNSGWW